MKSFIQHYRQRIPAGGKITIPARGQVFLCSRCATDAGEFKNFLVGFGGSNGGDARLAPLELGLSITSPEYFNEVHLANPHSEAINLRFYVSDRALQDNRLILNQDNPLPILMAELQALHISAMPAVQLAPQIVNVRNAPTEFVGPGRITLGTEGLYELEDPLNKRAYLIVENESDKIVEACITGGAAVAVVRPGEKVKLEGSGYLFVVHWGVGDAAVVISQCFYL